MPGLPMLVFVRAIVYARSGAAATPIRASPPEPSRALDSLWLEVIRCRPRRRYEHGTRASRPATTAARPSVDLDPNGIVTAKDPDRSAASS
jgi:hypothetical protein